MSNYDATKYSLEHHLKVTRNSKSFKITTDPSVQTVFGPIEDEE